MPATANAHPEAFILDEIIPLAEAEQRYLAWAERHFQGDRRSLADRLDLSTRTLFRKLSGLDADGADPAQAGTNLD